MLPGPAVLYGVDHPGRSLPVLSHDGRALVSWIFGTSFLWLIYYPILSCLKVLLFFHPKVKERLAFENKNTLEPGARSFKLDQVRADLCFEFSSEGEYQQVASLIDDCLSEGKKLELVFFSPSVEKTVLELQARHPNQIRYFRYPVLSLGFSSWISSETLILVRYDLFPEFLIWGMKEKRKLKFVWVSFKKERVRKLSLSAFKRAFLNRADSLIFSSDADATFAKELGFTGSVYDFRMEQIKRRMENRLQKFSSHFALYSEFKSFLETYPREKRLILGNAWPEDLFLLESAPADVLIVIVPHQLKPEIISRMQEQLRALGREAEIITDETKVLNPRSTILINKKGILCELYADFGKAYVGGGFGVSVHSLLEPLVAGSENLSCGPVNFRSTEFDLSQSYGSLKEIKNSQEFKDWLHEDVRGLKVHGKLEGQLLAYPAYKKEILS